MINAQHLRISLDGKTIWKDYSKQFINNKRIYCYFLHDYNLNEIKDSYELAKELSTCKKYTTYIGTKFPIQAYNAADLKKWLDLSIMKNNFAIQYNGIMEDELFYDFIIRKTRTSLPAQLHYNITYACSSENEFIENCLPKIFNQATFSRNNRVKILLKYDENFFLEKRWGKLIDLFNSYINFSIKISPHNEAAIWNLQECDSLYNFVSMFREYRLYNNELLTLSEARDLFKLVQQKNFMLFSDFYEKSKVELKGGKFINATSANSRSCR